MDQDLSMGSPAGKKSLHAVASGYRNCGTAVADQDPRRGSPFDLHGDANCAHSYSQAWGVPMAATHHPLKRGTAEGASWKGGIRFVLGVCAAMLLGTGAAAGQITINTQTGVVTNNSTGEVLNTINRRYAQVQPTHVPLSDTRLDPKTRMQLIRELMAEQGFAMRPLPFGHAGLTLQANGGLTPAGQAYLDLVNSEGVSSNPRRPGGDHRREGGGDQDHHLAEWGPGPETPFPAAYRDRGHARAGSDR